MTTTQAEMKTRIGELNQAIDRICKARGWTREQLADVVTSMHPTERAGASIYILLDGRTLCADHMPEDELPQTAQELMGAEMANGTVLVNCWDRGYYSLCCDKCKR